MGQAPHRESLVPPTARAHRTRNHLVSAGHLVPLVGLLPQQASTAAGPSLGLRLGAALIRTPAASDRQSPPRITEGPSAASSSYPRKPMPCSSWRLTQPRQCLLGGLQARRGLTSFPRPRPVRLLSQSAGPLLHSGPRLQQRGRL
ncbi:hypothetical protein NDU88_006939 [Pleurodeles waltl]|uniref:Uncharacterized protein n=1 Tax=Pleurodeles waltl TaxID=8319 RepID=A0AAV7U012_PLEWA|nr:hypothetical protein NDU88_006939 [Pleurodeles waltl]